MISIARLRLTPIFPVSFGLGKEMDNIFGSCWLIDKLLKLVFPFSIMKLKVARNYMLNAIAPEKLKFIQWFAIDVDQDI